VNYYFDHFVFNSQTLVLTNAGESLTIRHNESRLLVYFLENPQTVLSKDAILENVWVGKVVSEQAVFQAISNLRSLFGDDAIKTFPKKGYQWQLPLQPNSPQVIELDEPAVQQRSIRNYRLWSFAALSILGCLFGLYFLLASPATPAQNPVTIIIQPFMLDANNTGNKDIAQQVQDAAFEQINHHTGLIAHLPPSIGDSQTGYSTQQVIAAPAHFFNVYQESINTSLLVTAKVRQQGDSLHLSFILQGRENRWAGYLSGKTPAELATNFAALLGKTAPIKVLWEAQDRRLVNAQLHLLLSENPDSFPIRYQLIDNLLFLGDLHNAKMQAEELAQQAHNKKNLPYQSLALIAQVSASVDSVYPDNILVLLKQAAAFAEEFNDPVLLSQVLGRGTYIYYRQNDFTALENNLLRALALAEAAKAPEQQLEVLHALTIFSYKFKRVDKRDAYLARAKIILDEYQFPSESYALLEHFAGIYSDDQTQKEAFNRQALNRFKPEQEAWVKERAQEHLVNLYIDQERWADAFAVFAAETNLSGAELFFQAKIHFRQKNFALAQTQAEAAFKRANLEGEYLAALEAALLLAELYQQLAQPDLQKDALDYINKNASSLWKKDKQDMLTALTKTRP
jgi:DNA-binding winged helix-turn-helix (wHTH) protein